MSNYLNQIRPLEIASNLLDRQYFGPDDCCMIDRLLPKMNLNSTIVYTCLKDYRTLSISKLGFADKIVTLRTDLHKHLDKRIYLLRHLSQIRPNKPLLFSPKEAPKIGRDPWLKNIQDSDVDKNVLVAISLHVRDILFTTREIALEIPEKMKSFLEELEVFKDKLSKEYLTRVNHLTKKEKEKIQAVFDELYTLMKDGRLEEVSSHLSLIRKTLRHSGEESLNLDPKLSEETG